MALQIYTNSPEETRTLARQISNYLKEGDIILLSGDLGAGKTLFTKGIGEGLGIDKPITSPTFTIMQQYSGRVNLYHFDLYRIEDPEELVEVGLMEYMYNDGVTVVEWFEKMDEFPPEYLKIEIFGGSLYEESGEKRCLEFSSRGDRYEKIVKALREGG